MTDLVAHWEVPLYDKIHKIDFEHGTTTGRRVVRLDDEVRIFVSNADCQCLDCLCCPVHTAAAAAAVV